MPIVILWCLKILTYLVLREHSEVNKCKRDLVATAERLRFNAEFYLKTLTTDLNSFSRLTSHSNASASSINILGIEDSLQEWNQDRAEVEAYEQLRELTTQIEKKVFKLNKAKYMAKSCE